MTERKKPLLRMTERKKPLLRMTERKKPLLRMTASFPRHSAPSIVILSEAKNLFSPLKSSAPKILRSEAPQNDSFFPPSFRAPIVILSEAKNLFRSPHHVLCIYFVHLEQ